MPGVPGHTVLSLRFVCPLECKSFFYSKITAGPSNNWPTIRVGPPFLKKKVVLYV